MPANYRITTRMKGDPENVATIAIHDIDITISIVLASKCDLTTIWREFWKYFIPIMDCDALGGSSLKRDGPNIATLNKYNRVFMDIWKAHDGFCCSGKPVYSEAQC